MQFLSQEITLMEMDNETIQELIAGYAVGALDEDEIVQIEKLLQTSAEARQLLAEFEVVTTGLALSVEPVELPAGSLERLRQKAGVDIAAQTGPQSASPTRPRLASIEGGLNTPAHTPKSPITPRKTFWQINSLAAFAAALVLFVTTAVFGLLWLNTNNKLNEAQQTKDTLVSILSAPNLKMADLQPTVSNAEGNVRVYTDPSNNKVYLVAQNMTTLPGDKEYEAWLITTDSQPHQAGLLGTGPGKDTAIFELSATVPLNQYKQVALTIENKGGVPKPSSPPVMAGTLPV